MERRGGCCIAMCGVAGDGAGGDPAEVAWRMGRIMLRYRPIAPKPAASGASPAAGGPTETLQGRRAKRRSSGGGGRGRKAKKVEDNQKMTTTTTTAPPEKEEEAVKSSPSSSSSTISLSSSTGSAASPPSLRTAATAATLLPLMPEVPEEKPDNPECPEKPAAPGTMDHTTQTPPTPTTYAPPPWFFKGEGAAEAVARPRPVRPAGSWVTVECLTDAWRDGEVVAPNDEALRRALEADACPGFITDHRDRVTWVSESYRRMVTGLPAPSSPQENEEDEDDDDEQVTVGLVTRAIVPAAGECRAFTCRVRVRYASRRRGKGSLAAPCDVWRLADGGCAWRLDIKAALSLGI